MVTAVRVPRSVTGGRSAFVKLGARRYLVISIAMAAARVTLAADGTIREAAVAVGACSAVAQRLRSLEAELSGRRPGEVEEIIARAALDELLPIDDVRGSADYRRAAVREIVARAVLAAADDPSRRVAA